MSAPPADFSETPASSSAAAFTNTQLFIIAMVSYAFFIATASMGIWLANNCDDWSSHGTENAVKGILITFLVLALIMPIIYIMFRYKNEIINGVRGPKKNA